MTHTDTLQHQHGFALRLSQACFAVVIIALCMQFRRWLHGGRVDHALLFVGNCLFGTSSSSYDAWLAETGKFVMWWHAPIVFGMLYLFEGAAADSPLHYLLGCVAVFPLWDCAGGTQFDPITSILLNFHHAGAVIAYMWQPVEDPVIASRNTVLFAWAWAIHGLGFIQDVVLPRLGCPKVAGKKYLSMDIVRHLYGAITVYCYHLMLNGEGQPGLGWNYQTAAVFSLFLGRYLVNGNWKNHDWARRVEVPGVAFVTVAHCMGNNYTLAAATMTTAAIGLFSYKVARHSFTPEVYTVTPEIAQLLQSAVEEFQKVPKEEIKPLFPLEMAKAWWEDSAHDDWAGRWPLHTAAVMGDAACVEQLLEKDAASVDANMSDWNDSTPLTFASFMGHLDVALFLLQKGADPYLKRGGGGMPPVSALESLRSHSHSRAFADSLHALALKASPPKGGDSMSQRVLAVLRIV